MGGRIPGPLGKEPDELSDVRDGTTVLSVTPLPGPAGRISQKIEEDARALLNGDGSAIALDTGAKPAASADEKDPDIEQLDLSDTARKAAYALKKAFPEVRFTSGRRAKADQARAMAGNVVLNRKWIEQTYAKSKVRDECQKWVDDHPEAKTKEDIAKGILSVFDGLSDDEVGKISKHLTGDAFDVQPVEKDADQIKKKIEELAVKFLEKEGGLVRWHAQF